MGGVRILFDEQQVARRVAELADEIAAALPQDVTVVGILKGSFVFVADLVRALDRNGLRPGVDFIRLSSYGYGRESAEEVSLVADLGEEVAGRSILLVDDILDTGRSLAFARSLLLKQQAARAWSCALLDKPSRRQVEFAADFVGFTVDDVFVVGYGIDHAEKYRHLPYIGTID
ncbi:MAG: hypoxanthine phosphoribosyltransferase [Alphaproteobacteria bacterium]|jgi:hypoxanthine phosphoribosyltransferase|nr:hypoxanthine phosphoribosyltransferase [Alphaproteobacteria bacterium]